MTITLMPSKQKLLPKKIDIIKTTTDKISIIPKNLKVSGFKFTSLVLSQYLHLYVVLFFAKKDSIYQAFPWQYGHTGKSSFLIIFTP